MCMCKSTPIIAILQVNPKTMDVIKTVYGQAYRRYAAGPVERSDHTLRYYLDKEYLLDGKNPPINFQCFCCKARDHYISDCPVKNKCMNCEETGFFYLSIILILHNRQLLKYFNFSYFEICIAFVFVEQNYYFTSSDL